MMYVTVPSGCSLRRTASASMPMPIRSSELNISSACCLVRDIRAPQNGSFYQGAVGDSGGAWLGTGRWIDPTFVLLVRGKAITTLTNPNSRFPCVYNGKCQPQNQLTLTLRPSSMGTTF